MHRHVRRIDLEKSIAFEARNASSQLVLHDVHRAYVLTPLATAALALATAALALAAATLALPAATLATSAETATVTAATLASSASNPRRPRWRHDDDSP